ncbi:SDR family oxidoreductase [Streptomyces sp. NBC_01808]|uniref:SDR family NAD(P)-dependent oxidoreductase n=1 Tax=Streptomyces sp. NBC_01808 TaxID=2975947 RepID=UPI002DDB4C9C|nr:SDR family oxidoreductase [Streptomyces sp. NBC_01808]WSA40292.1 SDR family oxidoreductase [Streptomyces sp. NBC_01808]
MAGEFDGKVAVVTGGSRGIGAAVANRFAQEGASVVIGYNSSADEAHALKEELKTAGARCIAVRSDVVETEEVAALMNKAVDAFGRLDILAACAGISHFGALPTLSPQAADQVFAVNMRGQLFAAQHAAHHMADGGRIILTSSNAARRAVFEHTLYTASKAAVDAMVRCLSIELGQRGITINAVAPGATATAMVAQNAAKYQPPGMNLTAEEWLDVSYALDRLATPAEVAGAYAFLAGKDAAYISGRTLPVESCVF